MIASFYGRLVFGGGQSGPAVKDTKKLRYKMGKRYLCYSIGKHGKKVFRW